MDALASFATSGWRNAQAERVPPDRHSRSYFSATGTWVRSLADMLIPHHARHLQQYEDLPSLMMDGCYLETMTHADMLILDAPSMLPCMIYGMCWRALVSEGMQT